MGHVVLRTDVPIWDLKKKTTAPCITGERVWSPTRKGQRVIREGGWKRVGLGAQREKKEDGDPPSLSIVIQPSGTAR